MKRCQNGHYFDETKHSTCPACGVDLDLGGAFPRPVQTPIPPPTPPVQPLGDMGGTRRISAPTPPITPTPIAVPTPPSPPVAPTPIQAAGKTVALFSGTKAGTDPVVGWLVCIEGPDRGKDFRIHAERNFIGRNASMHIVLTDETVSRDKHAILTYNPKKSNFRLQAGESSRMVYVNDEDVDAAVDLNPYDTIELGRTKLKFVPFCGSDFMWKELEAGN